VAWRRLEVSGKAARGPGVTTVTLRLTAVVVEGQAYRVSAGAVRIGSFKFVHIALPSSPGATAFRRHPSGVPPGRALVGDPLLGLVASFSPAYQMSIRGPLRPHQPTFVPFLVFCSSSHCFRGAK